MPSQNADQGGARRASPSFWRDGDWYILRSMNQVIASMVRAAVAARGGKEVLDFGCGQRPYAPLIESLGLRYIAADLDDPADVRVVPGSPLNVPDASLGGILSVQVLEHVWDLDWYLGECVRLLHAQGWLVLSTHGTWLYHPHPTDFRRWTRDGLRRELESRGLVVEEMRAVAGPLAWTLILRTLGAVHFLRRLGWWGRVLATPLVALANGRAVLEDYLTPPAVREENACVYVVLARPQAPKA